MDDDKDLPELDLDLDKDDKGGGDTEVPEDETPEDDADTEGSAEDADGDEGEDEDQPQAQPKGEDERGRASSRIAKLANERKAERERAEKAERDVAALRAQMEEVQRRLSASQQPDPNAEAELLANMDPVERVKYESDKKINQLQSEIRRVQMTSIDAADKSEFLKGTHSDLSLRTKYLAKVEENLAGMRKNGLNAPRDEIYAYLIGKAHIERMQKAGGKNPDREAAKKRVTDTQGRTVSARSDASSGRGRGKTAEDRLENVLL